MTDTTRAFRTSSAFALIWIALAWWRPTVTYHLAPLTVVAGGVVVSPAASGVFISSSVAGVAILALDLTGRLAGPSLLPIGDATLEAAVAALVGLVIGWWLSTTRLAPGNSQKRHDNVRSET